MEGGGRVGAGAQLDLPPPPPKRLKLKRFDLRNGLDYHNFKDSSKTALKKEHFVTSCKLKKFKPFWAKYSKSIENIFVNVQLKL